jgi:micrococcal nuclease
MFTRHDSTYALSLIGILLVLMFLALSHRQPLPMVRQPSAATADRETTASIALPAINESPWPYRQRIPVEILRVMDGDTVELRAHIWLDQQVQVRIRLRAIDAPELKAACAREQQLAEAAKDHLGSLLASGKAWLGDVGRDKFGGRFLGTLHDSTGRDISQMMLASGHARPYDGRKRLGWC